MRRRAVGYGEATDLGARSSSVESSEIMGMTIAIELAIGGGRRTIKGVIVDAPEREGKALHVALEDLDGTGGSPILMIPETELQPGERFGCDFFLSLAGACN